MDRYLSMWWSVYRMERMNKLIMRNILGSFGFIGVCVIVIYALGWVFNNVIFTSPAELQRICADFHDSKLERVDTNTYVCINDAGKITNTRLSGHSSYRFHQALYKCYKQETKVSTLAVWQNVYACIDDDGVLLWKMDQ